VWAELEPEAATSLRRRLVLQRFVQVEGIRVSSREVDDAVDRLRRPLGRTARRVLPPVDVLRRSAGSRMLTSRAVDRLLEIAAANAATEAGETQVGSETGDPDPPREGSAAGTTDPQPKKA
jgi:FKBP-type peptidyl-prolyl cis-trans isomerase (trigger factor)